MSAVDLTHLLKDAESFGRRARNEDQALAVLSHQQAEIRRLEESHQQMLAEVKAITYQREETIDGFVTSLITLQGLRLRCDAMETAIETTDDPDLVAQL